MNEQLLQQILETLKDMKSEMSELKAEQHATNRRLDRMENDIADIKKDTSLLPFVQQAVHEVDGVVKRMESEQDHYKAVVDILSARSINQEAALKRIK